MSLTYCICIVHQLYVCILECVQHYIVALLSLCTDPNFVDLLNYRFDRKPSEGKLRDIYDGCAYQNVDFFREKFNLSFTLNYDGAPKFKSSNTQIWPILLYLNELPPNMR